MNKINKSFMSNRKKNPAMDSFVHFYEVIHEDSTKFIFHKNELLGEEGKDFVNFVIAFLRKMHCNRLYVMCILIYL